MLILVPGPAAITVASQAASNTTKPALFGVLGVASADALFFILSATGIATLIVTSNLMFTIVKWVGVLYLVYLGLSAFFGKGAAIKINKTNTLENNKKLFYQGFIVQLANPKALMYFSALLPQFIDIEQPIIPQILIMGITCVIADILVYSLYAKLGSQLAREQVKEWMINLLNKAAGIALITTAIRISMLDNNESS